MRETDDGVKEERKNYYSIDFFFFYIAVVMGAGVSWSMAAPGLGLLICKARQTVKAKGS